MGETLLPAPIAPDRPPLDVSRGTDVGVVVVGGIERARVRRERPLSTRGRRLTSAVEPVLERGDQPPGWTAWLGEAEAARGRVVVGGEAGIGKSTVVATLTHRVAGPGSPSDGVDALRTPCACGSILEVAGALGLATRDGP